MKPLVLALSLLCLFPCPAWAGIAEANAAYEAADYETAVRELRPLAENGNARAQRKLGWLYERGLGVDRNNLLAVKWYRLAAEQGDADGQFALGTMYHRGYGVSQDYARAFQWYRKAAEQGNANGQFNLGFLYENGYGVEQDQPEAAKWFRLAADQGHEAAGQELASLEASVAPIPLPYPERLRANPPVTSVDAPPLDPERTSFGVFETVPGNPYVLVLDGDIGPNTPLELRRALSAQPEVRLLILNSRGGLVSPALVVAYAVRDRGLATYISQSSVCYSACSFIFFAGQQRTAAGQLGVHQVWNTANDLISGQTVLADVLEALRAFGTNDAVISTMMRTPPNDLYVFRTNELAGLSIDRGNPLADAVQLCLAHKGCKW